MRSIWLNISTNSSQTSLHSNPEDFRSRNAKESTGRQHGLLGNPNRLASQLLLFGHLILHNANYA